MEIRQLRYFISVAHHLNFTRAAQECFVVQTTMTHQIAALENELGIRLFDRTKRSVALTAEGEVFLVQAEEIVRQADTTLEIINNMKGNYNSFLHIGYWGNLFRNDLPMILREFRRQYPQVRVELKQGNVDDLLEQLQKGQLDLAFCCFFDVLEHMEWLKYMPLFDDPLYAVLAEDHPLSSETMLTTEQIAKEKMITFPGIGAADLSKRVPTNISIVEEHHKSIMMMVEAGYGITLCCKRGLQNDMGAVKAIPMDSSVPMVQGVVCWNKDHTTDAQVKMLTQVAEYYDEIDRSEEKN